MDHREILTYQVKDILEKERFFTSDITGVRSGCVDLLAKKDLFFLLFKVLTNIDSLSPNQAAEIHNITNLISGSPLVVGNKTRNSYLEEGVVYERYGIPAISPNTLEDIIRKNILPFVISLRGGFHVNLDCEALKTAKEEKDISRGRLAGEMGVSKKTIYNYEMGTASATLENALKLEEFFDKAFIRPIDLFRMPRRFQSEKSTINDRFTLSALSDLDGIGFEVYVKTQESSSAITKETRSSALSMIKTESRDQELTELSLKIISMISRAMENEAFIITEKEGAKESIGGVPVINKEELEKITDPEDLLRKVMERRGKWPRWDNS